MKVYQFRKGSMLKTAFTRLSAVHKHLLVQPAAFGRRWVSSAASSILASRQSKPILDSSISYLDTKTGDNAVIFLHGNPTSSFLWRDVIPHVQPIARCLAPDLIGMGKSGKEPNNNYRFVDHYRYLCAWIDSMDLPEKVTVVGHDWGSGLGFHWCHENQARVKSVAFMEGIPGPLESWNHWPEVSRKMFKLFRTEAGDDLILKKNVFVERLLPGAIMRKLEPEEMEMYREPFKEEGEARRPTLTWPREIPVISDGPEDVVRIASEYSDWLSKSSSIPKLYIDAEPGFLSPYMRETVKNWPNLKTAKVKGLHFIQEDSSEDIGKAIASFLKDQS